MARIFEFNKKLNGSYIDTISNIIGVNSGSSFKKTEKGISAYLQSGNSITYTGLSFDLINLITECKGVGTLRITIGSTNNDIVLTDNRWSFEKDTFSLSSQTSITITVTSGYAYVNRIFGFNHSLSTLEYNNLYKDFLRPKATGTSIYKNDYPIKSTDLSRFKNMGIQTDINIQIPRSTPNNEYWVRPLGTMYGTGDGSSYENAFSGFLNIDTLQPGDILHVRGTHNERFLCGSAVNVGTVDNYITIDFGADTENDYGIIDGQNAIPTGILANGRYYIGFEYPRTKNVTTDGVKVYGAAYGMIFRTGDFSYSGNQGTQLEDTAKAIFYNCNSHHNTDDGFSQHDTANGWYYYCNGYNNDQGANTANAATTMNLYGCDFYDNTTDDINAGTGSTINKYYTTTEKADVGNVVEKVTGLVAAYNMIPSSGGVLVDISGNGNNGTITESLSTKNGMQSNGHGSNSRINFASDIINSTVWCFQFRINSYTVGATFDFLFGNGATSPLVILNNGNKFGFRDANSNYYLFNGTGNTEDIPSSTLTVNTTISMCSNGINIYVYVNGISKGYITPSTTLLNLTRFFEAFSTTAWTPKIDLGDVEIYNRSLSEQEIKLYHNQFVKPVIISDFEYDGVGSFPVEYQKGTGSYEIKETITDGKYLECTSAGTCAIQSETAYGEWEFELCRCSAGNKPDMRFIADRIDTVAGTYAIYFDDSGRLQFRNNGSVSGMFYTATSYIALNTLYKVKVKRTNNGEFTVYIKGGAFGNTYVLVDPTGGAGTNPIISISHTTSKYIVKDLDVGDRFKDLKVTNGIKQ